ncbi:MAG: hypothetical protein JRG85_16970 [Deltaproteobacteria bacterium]|nr:hypothetical protein [Deltaproteobacteria bacterium]
MELGWLTQSGPREYGGSDALPWRHAILGEPIWGNGEPRGPRYMNVNWMGPAIPRSVVAKQALGVSGRS